MRSTAACTRVQKMHSISPLAASESSSSDASFAHPILPLRPPGRFDLPSPARAIAHAIHLGFVDCDPFLSVYIATASSSIRSP